MNIPVAPDRLAALVAATRSLREDATVTDSPVTQLNIRGYGRTAQLIGPVAALDTIVDKLPPSLRPTTQGASVDARLTLEPDAHELAADVLLGELELWFAGHARRRVFVHAAAVTVRGRAIVLPGRTRSGKTSLAAALVRLGATYYSDEYAVLDAHGLVRPYARPLAIRSPDRWISARVAVDDRSKVPRGPCPVGLVALLSYQEDARFAPSRLSPADGVLGLIDNAVAAQSRPRAVLTACAAVMDTATAVRGERGDADETANALLAEVAW